MRDLSSPQATLQRCTHKRWRRNGSTRKRACRHHDPHGSAIAVNRIHDRQGLSVKDPRPCEIAVIEEADTFDTQTAGITEAATPHDAFATTSTLNYQTLKDEQPYHFVYTENCSWSPSQHCAVLRARQQHLSSLFYPLTFSRFSFPPSSIPPFGFGGTREVAREGDTHTFFFEYEQGIKNKHTCCNYDTIVL